MTVVRGITLFMQVVEYLPQSAWNDYINDGERAAESAGIRLSHKSSLYNGIQAGKNISDYELRHAPQKLMQVASSSC